MPKRERGWYLKECSPEERYRITSSGGHATAQKPGHMQAIGRKGGAAVSRDREHMGRIGRIGGAKPKRRFGHA